MWRLRSSFPDLCGSWMNIMLLVCSQERRWPAASESSMHRVRDASGKMAVWSVLAPALTHFHSPGPTACPSVCLGDRPCHLVEDLSPYSRWADAVITHLSDGRIEEVSPRLNGCPRWLPCRAKRAVSPRSRPDPDATTHARFRFSGAGHASLGSGLAEAACKTEVFMRARRSGICGFPPAGSDAILAVYTSVLTGEFDLRWHETRASACSPPTFSYIHPGVPMLAFDLAHPRRRRASVGRRRGCQFAN